MNQAFLLALSLFVVALAGCADDGGSADDLKDEFKEKNEGTGAGTGGSSSSSSGSSSSGSNSNGETGETEEGEIILNAASAVKMGNIPFTASINIAGKARNADGTLGDNASIEWAIFDADENSTSGIVEEGIGLPADVNVTFTEVGNYSLAIGGKLDGYASGFQVLNFTALAADAVIPAGGPETWNLLAGAGGATDWQLSKSQASAFAGNLVVAQAGLVEPYTAVFLPDSASVGHDAGVDVAGSISYFSIVGFVYVSIDFELKADGVSIGTQSIGPDVGPTPMGNTIIDFSFATTGEVPAGADITLEITVQNVTYYEPSAGSFVIG